MDEVHVLQAVVLLGGGEAGEDGEDWVGLGG